MDLPNNILPSTPPNPSLSPHILSTISTTMNRISLDSDDSSLVTIAPPDMKDNDEEFVSKLQRDLERTQQEKNTLAAQYGTLLAKLTQMRKTLGNKLKQDAEELDRREQLVQQLTMEKDDLNATVDSLKEELIISNGETERAESELDSMRGREQDSLLRDHELREIQTKLERYRMEREEWEMKSLQDRAMIEESTSMVESLSREFELEKMAKEMIHLDLKNEKQKSENLQSVLQDFQAAKDHELREAVKDFESRLMQVTQSLAEYKHRALTAEVQLEELHTNMTRLADLEKEIKEKNLLIGKLRHEGVIANEHLMEALRRLRRNSTDVNVDRRLVTNIILSFLMTPRADPKRFEMLSLLSSILSWTEDEREKAGLLRASGHSTSLRERSSTSSTRSGKGEFDKPDEMESFSRLWVEFLLTEAASGGPQTSTTPTRNHVSLPGSLPSSPKPRRIPSLVSSGINDSPNFNLLLATASSVQKGKTNSSDA